MAFTFPASPTVGQVFTSGTVSWQWDGVAWRGTGTSGINLLRTDQSGAITGSLTVSGTVTAATFTETSTRDLKTNFRKVENALETVLQLSAWIYDRKDGSEIDELGMIADDVGPVINNLVMYDDDGNPVGIKYTRVSVLCIEAIKELHNEIQMLKQIINK